MPQIVRAMHLQMRGGVGEARVQLDPQHLGAVSVALRVQGTMVTAVISAEQPAVRQWLETHEHTLRQALVEQGLDLHRLLVEEDEPRRDRHEQEAERYVPRRVPRRRETATFELVA
jgi:flagellar hook-length control protein FliK